MTLANQDFQLFRDFLEKACGIVLGDNKQYLVSSRLNRLLEQEGIANLGELVKRIQAQPRGGLREAVIDAMTTNETLWFRDSYPFELLIRQILPTLATRQRRIRIWSAACSSGQEPYSIAMSLLEYQRKNPGAGSLSAEILATDLSSNMLRKCEEGAYDELSLARGLSAERRQRYFQQHASGMLQVKPEVRRMVSFRSLNLLHSYSSLGKFDIVFCRNVLIYFSTELKQKILQQIAAQLNPGGILFLGASESVAAAADCYRMVKCNPGLYYTKKD